MWVLGNPRLIAAFPMTSMQPGASGKAADSNCCPQSAARFGSHISRSSPTHTARSRAWTDQNKARGTLQIRSLRTGLESRLNYSHSIVNQAAQALWGRRSRPVPRCRYRQRYRKSWPALTGFRRTAMEKRHPGRKKPQTVIVSRRFANTIPSLIPSSFPDHSRSASDS
jgi:hypothetical protein